MILRKKYIVLLIVLVPVSYLAYYYASAEYRVKKLCAEVKIGSKYYQLDALARKHGFRGIYKDKEGKVVYLVESITLGIWVCKVNMEAELAKSVELK